MMVPQTQQGGGAWPLQGGAMQNRPTQHDPAQNGPVLNGPGLVPPQPVYPPQPDTRQPMSLPPTPSQGDLPWADAATLPGEVPPMKWQQDSAAPVIGMPAQASAPPQMAPQFPSLAPLPWQREVANAAASNTPSPVVPSEVGARIAGPLHMVPPTGVQPPVTEPTPALPTPAQPEITPPTVTDPLPMEPSALEPSVAEPTTAEPKLAQPSVPGPTVNEPSHTYDASPKATPAAPAAVGAVGVSPQVYEQVSRHAVQHIAKGFELADRRMFYAARREFHRALEVIAQALDLHESTQRHTTALVNGLRAMDEASDFQNRALDVDRDVREIAASHRTPVLHNLAEPISPLAAAQQYYAYAQEQLALAVKPLQAGSAALSALGKLHHEIAREENSFVENPLARVKVFHQAALLVDVNNWHAANELAVFLVRSGHYEEARGWFQHSIAVSPQPETWHNLACLHAKLGEHQLAQIAQEQARRLAGIDASGQPASITSPVDVQWLDPEQFASVSANLPLESLPPGGAVPSVPASGGQPVPTGQAAQTKATNNGTAQRAPAATAPEKAPATANQQAGGPAAPRTKSWFPWKR